MCSHYKNNNVNQVKFCSSDNEEKKKMFWVMEEDTLAISRTSTKIYVLVT